MFGATQAAHHVVNDLRGVNTKVELQVWNMEIEVL
jgi:hypothetical protein